MPDFTPPEIISLMNVIDTYLRWRDKQNQKSRNYVYLHPSEFGKAQPVDAMVQTPEGPKRMGDLQVGDDVLTPQGGVSAVVIIHPQGQKSVFKISFSDGSSTECCGDHLWLVDNVYMGYKTPKVLSTKYIKETHDKINQGKRYKKNTFSIPVTQPLQFANSAPNVIKPYTMGVLLGDGCLSCSSVDIINIDNDIVGKVRSQIMPGYDLRTFRNGTNHRIRRTHKHIRNIYKSELEKFALKGVKSESKFIPNEYLYVREEDRWELLRGLMDTDGTINKRGYASFSTSSKKLFEQFRWLVESLGGACSLYRKTTSHLPHYVAHIRLNQLDKVFHTSRKKERVIRKISPKDRRLITSIDPIGDKECRCITIDSNEHLYLTDHCIVTHNCLRRAQYKRYVDKGFLELKHAELESQTLRLFDKGHNMHDRWVGYWDSIGVLRGVWSCSNPMCFFFDDEGKPVKGLSKENRDSILDKQASRIYGKDDILGVPRPNRCRCGNKGFVYREINVINDDLQFTGHVDQVLDFSLLDSDKFEGVRKTFNVDHLPKSPLVVDMKTCNSRRFKKIQKEGPDREYVIQLTIYVHLLEIDEGCLIYECKDDSSMVAFPVNRDQELYDRIVETAQAMNAMVESKKLPPPKPKSKSSYECQYCEFGSICLKSKIWMDHGLDEKREKFYSF